MNQFEKRIVMLEPSNYLIYIIMMILSIIVFLLSTMVLLLFLRFQYRKWAELMRQYNTRFILMNNVPKELIPKQLATSIATTSKGGMEVSEFLNTYTADVEKEYRLEEEDANQADEDDNLELSSRKIKKKRKKKMLKARICNIRYPLKALSSGSVLSDTNKDFKVVEAIELEPLDINEIEEDLGKLRKYYGPDKEIGRLSFSVEYLEQSSELKLTNIQGEGLRKLDSQAILNPFIIIYIWPDNQWSIKTKVIKKTNTPKWEESIIIENFDEKRMIDKALHFKCLNWRNLQRNEVIGHVLLPLKIFNFNDNFRSQIITKNLQPNLKVNKGTMKILLKFNDTGELEITIVKANIIYPPGFIPDQCQVFTKVTVTNFGDTVLAGLRTTTIRGTFSPQWYEKVEFVLPEEHRNMLINIAVREEGFSKDGNLFGYLEMSMKHLEADKVHLTTALQNPNRVISRWHQLVSNL